MTTNISTTLDRGVEYNIKITKRKHKDNIYATDSYSIPLAANAALGEVEDCHSAAAEPHRSFSGAIAHSTPSSDLITQDLVKTALLQLFKNDEQNYKLKLRLNLTDDTDVDFIAKLTTDRRNFKKYIPAGCEEWFVQWSDTQCKEIKEHYGVRAYRGKFHLAQTFKPGRKTLTQVEPWSQCVVWFNTETKNWMVALQTYEFSLLRELTSEGITLRQSKNNLHRHDIWRNPKYDQRQRPKTWAELRKEQK